jgi:hypothetical protein
VRERPRVERNGMLYRLAKARAAWIRPPQRRASDGDRPPPVIHRPAAEAAAGLVSVTNQARVDKVSGHERDVEPVFTGYDPAREHVMVKPVRVAVVPSNPRAVSGFSAR